MRTFTLAGPCELEREIKRSRFLAVAAPLANADQAGAIIETLSLADASHRCWAWRYGDHYRSADDGEPSGSAGRPILAAIDGQPIDRVAVVVMRWFGGTKLGIGGLVRAYGGTAAECLRLGDQVEIVATVDARLGCGFEHADAVHRLLSTLGASVMDERFDVDGIELSATLPGAALDALRAQMAEITRGRGYVRAVD